VRCQHITSYHILDKQFYVPVADAVAVTVVLTVVFNIGNIRDADEARVLDGVYPEQKADKCTVCTRRCCGQTAHVVMVIDEADRKPWCTVQRNTHAPYVPLRSDASNCTN